MRRANGLVLETFNNLADDGECVTAQTDIPAWKKAEREIINAKDQLEIANRVKTDLLVNMGHELRTPLNGIIGFSEIIGS